MSYRTESFDEFLSEQLQDADMAREFLLSSMEGKGRLPLIEALKRTISSMGIKEFSKMSGIHRNTISRMLSQEDIPKITTLDKYLLAFGLKSKITIVEVDEVA